MKCKLLKSIVIILSIFFISCSNNTDSIKEKELELKAKELELKEREINAKEKSVSETNNSYNKVNKPSSKKSKRELRYLYFSNGGIIGYFDDGTIAGCPRCDFMKSNIINMFEKKPHGKYTVEADGSLLINGSERETPIYNSNDFEGWALIDYKWYIKPEYNTPLNPDRGLS